jgi:phage terminase large subunit-like protein
LSDWTYADKVHGGFDLGRCNDFAGACRLAAFTEVDDSGEEFTRYEAAIAAWTCRDRNEEIATEQVRQWVNDGLLFECSGNQINYNDIEDWIVAQTAIDSVRTWAYDPAFAHQMGQRLQELHGIAVFPFPQNAFRYNEPTRKLVEKLLHETRTVNGVEVRLFTHDGNPLFAWCANNLMIRRDNRDQWMPDKIGSPFKIDPMVSCIMALSECVFSDVGGYWKPGSIRL